MLKALAKIFGTKNDKQVKKYRKQAGAINLLEDKYASLTDSDLQAAFDVIRTAVRSEELSLKDALNDVFAIVREVGKRTLNMRHFDVQLIGANRRHGAK